MAWAKKQMIAIYLWARQTPALMLLPAYFCRGTRPLFAAHGVRRLPGCCTVAMLLAKHCTTGCQHRFAMLLGLPDHAAVLLVVAKLAVRHRRNTGSTKHTWVAPVSRIPAMAPKSNDRWNTWWWYVDVVLMARISIGTQLPGIE